MSSIGGQRSRIAQANFSPSIEPGMSMSVKTMRMSFRASKMAMASSALDASIALYPAPSTKSAACIRLKNSSSTTRTYGCDAEIKILPWDLKSDASRNNEANLQNPDEGRTFQVLSGTSVCAIRNVAGNGIAARSGFATPGPQMSKRSTVLEVEK
jgi:hypothetical protein